MSELKGSFFNLEELNPGTCFELEGGGKIYLRVCAGDDYRKIRKQSVTKKVDYKNAQRFPYDSVNEDLENKLLWDFCIVNWENLFSDVEKTMPIPCTTENKMLLMGKSLKFSRFVSDCLSKLTEIDVEQEEIERKNL